MELLEKYFDIALETPDGIKKLRELILSLAMQGKLVPQDPYDQHVSELMKEIAVIKNEMIKEGKFKKQSPLPPIKPEEIPYSLPNSWEWVRLEEICTLITDGTHLTPSYTNNGVPFLSVKDLSTGKLVFLNTKFISQEEHLILSRRCKPELNDILLTKIGTTGIAVVVNTDRDFSIFVSVALLKIINSKIYPYYLEKLINSPLVKKYSEEGTEGVGNKNLVLRKIREFIIPIPPIEEQKRIVAKIDQLMALCDKLETERNERNSKRLKVHTAAINELLTASDEPEFNKSLNFITKNFAELYSVPENVEELKKAILQLAVMGKLVPQDPKDKPASELLRIIENEKKRLIDKGKVKRHLNLSAIKPSKIPYEIPNNWVWVQLSSIGEINPRNNAADEIEAGFVPMPLIFADYGIKHKCEIKKWSEIKKGYTHFADNDVALAKITPCFENGKSCVFEGLPNGIGAGTTELHIFRNTFNAVYPQYLLTYLKNPSYIQEGKSKMTGSAGQKRVPTEYFASNPFPLPPLAEQKRIVTKIDQLMEFCNALQQQLNDSTKKKTAILNGVLQRR